MRKLFPYGTTHRTKEQLHYRELGKIQIPVQSSWGLRVCISNKLPGDVYTAGSWAPPRTAMQRIWEIVLNLWYCCSLCILFYILKLIGFTTVKLQQWIFFVELYLPQNISTALSERSRDTPKYIIAEWRTPAGTFRPNTIHLLKPPDSIEVNTIKDFTAASH